MLSAALIALLAIGFFPARLLSLGPPSNERALAAQERAIEYMENNAFHLAIDELNRALGSEEHPDLYVLLGRCYRTINQRKLAYFAFKKAWKREKDNTEALVSLADLSFEFGSIEEIESLLPKLAELSPNVARNLEKKLLYKKAEEAEKRGEHKTAFRYYERAYHISSGSKRASKACQRLLLSMAKRQRKNRNYSKELNILLRLYHFEASKGLGRKIAGALKRANRITPLSAKKKREAMAVIEHARSLRDASED